MTTAAPPAAPSPAAPRRRPLSKSLLLLTRTLHIYATMLALLLLFFFALTGFHGVHVTIGIVMLLSTAALSWKGHIDESRAEAVEIVGLYWHFVDVVWILIFTVVYLIK